MDFLVTLEKLFIEYEFVKSISVLLIWSASIAVPCLLITVSKKIKKYFNNREVERLENQILVEFNQMERDLGVSKSVMENMTIKLKSLENEILRYQSNTGKERL